MRHRYDNDRDPDDLGHDYPRDVEVHVSERDDRVLYGPKGEVISVLRDRPWRGFRGR